MFVWLFMQFSLISAFCFVHNNNPIYVLYQVNIFNVLLACGSESREDLLKYGCWHAPNQRFAPFGKPVQQ